MAEPIITPVAEPELVDPVAVVAFGAWTDAGATGSLAVAHLAATWNAEPLAELDTDRLLDYRSNRPMLDIDSGIRGPLQWPQLTLTFARTGAVCDFVLLSGPEPDLAWRAFCGELVDLVRRLGVRRTVSLGAIPAAVPHTRPVPLLTTAARAGLVDSAWQMQGTFRVPAGATSATESSFGHAGLEAVGLWAQVPHYLSQSPYPAASSALLRRLSQHVGIPIDVQELDDAAERVRQQADEAIADQPEAQAFIRNLEQLAPPAGMEIATGDEIASEIERYLRDQKG